MEQSSSPPRSRLWISLVALLLLSGLTVVLVLVSRSGPPLEVYARVPDFELIERSGKNVRASDLEGRVWVANFIFSRCAGPCPLMSAQMSGLQSQFEQKDGVRFVSFSVDPLADTPAALSVYADKYHADPERWLFLTGEVPALYSLIEKGFLLPTGPMPPLDKVEPGDLIIHTTRFVLVDADRQIRGYYDSEEPEFATRLEADIRRLL